MNNDYLRQVHAAKTAFQRNSTMTEAEGQTPAPVKITWRKGRGGYGETAAAAEATNLPTGGLEHINGPSRISRDAIEDIRIFDEDMDGKPLKGLVSLMTSRGSSGEKEFSSISAAKSWADKQPLDLKGFSWL